MQIDTFANRLKKAMSYKDMKQIELAEKSGLDKSLISNYLSGKYKAKQDKLTILADLLDVSETWLMGYNIDDSSLDQQSTKLKVYKYEKEILEINNFILIENIGKISSLLSIIINDSSMTDIYQLNDIVILNKDLPYNSGNDCLIEIDGFYYFRRILKQDQKIIFQALNTKSESFYYTEKEFIEKNINIIGTAIELRRTVRSDKK